MLDAFFRCRAGMERPRRVCPLCGAFLRRERESTQAVRRREPRRRGRRRRRRWWGCACSLSWLTSVFDELWGDLRRAAAQPLRTICRAASGAFKSCPWARYLIWPNPNPSTWRIRSRG